MTAEDFTAQDFVRCLDVLRWNNEDAAEECRCDKRRIRRFRDGSRVVPPELAAWLRCLADHRVAHPAPLHWTMDEGGPRAGTKALDDNE